MTAPSIVPAAHIAALTAADAALDAAATAVRSALAVVVADPAQTTTAPPVTQAYVVTNLKAVAGPGAGQITVTWTNPTPAPTGFSIGRNGVEATGGVANWSGTAQAATNSLTFNNLAVGFPYTFFVQPNSGTKSTVSATILAVTPPPVVVPPPVTGDHLPCSIGVWTGDPSNAALVKQFEAGFGQLTQVITTFGSRGTPAELVGPFYAIDAVTAQGKVVCISFEGDVSDGENSGESFRTLDRGTVQARAAQFGANLVAHGQPNAIIRMRTEADNDSSGDEPVNAWNPADIAAYATFVQAMYTGLKSVAGQNFICLADVAFDPGNNTNKIAILQAVLKWCDGFGLDDYNTAAPWGSAWTNEADEWNYRYFGYAPNNGIGYKAYLDFALANNKPVYIPELGPGAEFDNNGAAQAPLDANGTFYTNMFNVVMTHGAKFGAVCFWEAPGAGIFVNAPSSRPETAAAIKNGFGSKPGAPFPH